MATALDVIKEALQEIGVIAAGETPSNADSDLGLSKLNDILDAWNAQKLYVYAQTIGTYDLVAATQSRTIGPTGNYVVTPRPVEIIRANLINGSIRTPIEVRDSAWWMGLSNRSVSGLPTDLYYNPSHANGTLYFWPVPDSSSYDVELETRTVLSELATTATTFSFPPGYRVALKLTLAEALCGPFGKTLVDKLMLDAMKARAVIQNMNSRAPKIDLGGGGRAYDITTGGFV